jgi:sirohydrochlorin ferrochelatase
VVGHPVVADRRFTAAARAFVRMARERAPDLEFVAANAIDGASVRRALRRGRGRPVAVLPLLMGQGPTYDSVKLAVGAFPGVRLCRPIGTWTMVTRLARDLGIAACARQGWVPRRTRLLLVAHGAVHDPRAQETARRHATRMRTSGVFGRVDTAYLEAEPRFDRATVEHRRATVVVALFLGRGRHVVEDVEEGLAHAGPAVAYGGSVGDAEQLVTVGLQRARAHLARRDGGKQRHAKTS